MNMGTERRTPWALIGLGLQGRRLTKAMRLSKTASLRAVIAEDLGRAKKFAEEFRVPEYYDSLPKALAKSGVRAVAIASKNGDHARHAIQALGAGKDVLCEKPLTVNMKEAMAVARVARRSDRKFEVDFHLRQHPAVRRAREMIARGALGRLAYVEMQWSIGAFGEKKLPPLPAHMTWREEVRQAGGTLTARGVHLFDLLRFLTGKEIAEVRAYDDASAREADLTAVGILLLDGGTPAVIVTSKRIPAAENRITLYGRDGKLALQVFGGASGGGVLAYASAARTYQKKFLPVDPYAEVFNNFGKRSGGNATLEDGIETVALTEAFRQSAKQRRAVRVK